LSTNGSPALGETLGDGDGERERESTIKSGYKSFNMFERSSFHLCSIIGGSEVVGGPKSSWISHYETEKRGSFGMMTLNGMIESSLLGWVQGALNMADVTRKW